MKILVMGDRKRYEKYAPQMNIIEKSEIIYIARDACTAAALEAAPDAGILFADAISRVGGDLLKQMKNLKMVHSEGVAYNGIDVETAKELGIYVCNNKGANAGAVAEQAIYLMLALLRSGIAGDAAVRDGRQIEMKEARMREGITDLADCRVGLVGLGDIGQATAQRLNAFGCELYYYSLHRKSAELEKQLKLTWLPLNRLAAACDIISLHMAVTPDTAGIINQDFLSHMKKSSYLINTARGELVDNHALRAALIQGLIAGAGLDTVAPEPVTKDNPLVTLPEDCKDHIIFSPHLGGITSGSFRRMHRKMWENADRISRCERPDNIVNGL